MNEKYSNNIRYEAYQQELERIAKESGPVRAFTDEENLKLHKELNEGMDKFLLECKNNKFYAELEMKTIVINS